MPLPVYWPGTSELREPLKRDLKEFRDRARAVVAHWLYLEYHRNNGDREVAATFNGLAQRESLGSDADAQTLFKETESLKGSIEALEAQLDKVCALLNVA